MNFAFSASFAVREEPEVDGGSITLGEFVGCVLFEMDDHLMGGPGKAHHESMERLRQRIKFGKWHRLLQGRALPFSVDATSHSYRIEALRLTWRDLSESLRSISLPHGRCLDSSAEASEVEVKALRAVAGSLSWVARQCCLDEAGTASTLQSSVSRAVVKNLSDANRAVNRLKQTEDVGLLIHTILLVNLRTMSISAAVLDLDRPDGSRQGGFMVGYLHQQGSAAMFPMFRLSPLWLEMSSWWAKVWLSVNVSVVYWNRRSIKTTSHRYRLICPQCTIDAKSAFDHLVRVSTGRLCTRTAL